MFPWRWRLAQISSVPAAAARRSTRGPSAGWSGNSIRKGRHGFENRRFARWGTVRRALLNCKHLRHLALSAVPPNIRSMPAQSSFVAKEGRQIILPPHSHCQILVATAARCRLGCEISLPICAPTLQANHEDADVRRRDTRYACSLTKRARPNFAELLSRF